MTTLEKIIQDLSKLDEHQLEQISAIIQTLNNQPQRVPCDRKNILQFIQQARQRHPQRATEEIDRDLQAEREAWDS
jgi:mRNA-degrading endonuclease RelE of RelBE toxin-antitoxin system